MMKTKTMGFVALVSISIIILSVTAVVGTLGVIAPVPNEATAQEPGVQEFDAILTGASEVPPVQTSASGFAELEVEEGSDNMEYAIIVMNIDKVTMAHIHQGSSTEAGPLVATLFNASTPTGSMMEIDLTNGFITSANLEGPLQGKQLSDLIALMQNGQAYVNVHTEQNPEGEIRGTIVADTD
jgi:CHRD domain